MLLRCYIHLQYHHILLRMIKDRSSIFQPKTKLIEDEDEKSW
jgi:hypothetical protein